MTIYTVLSPPPRPNEITPDPLSLVFVKEGFCWPALFFPEIWLLFRRMWLVLLLDVVVIVAASVLLSQAAPDAWILLLPARFLFALEGNGLRRWTYYRHGYRLLGVVEGRRLWEAELRFFLDWAPETFVPQPPLASEPPKPKPPSPEAGEVIGLFPAPGGAA